MTHFLILSGSAFHMNVRERNTKHFSAAIWLPYVLFSLQINPIINIIMMIPSKTLAPKKKFTNIISEDAIHGHALPPGDHLHHGDSRLIY